MDRELFDEQTPQHLPQQVLQKQALQQLQQNELILLLHDGVERWNNWRNQHPQVQLNLARATLGAENLSEANLSEVVLTRANLQGANLRKANLTRANLAGANLKGANLNGANLQNACLKWANLARANLQRANLQDVDFSGVDLSGADLSGANLQGATLTDAKLTQTILPDGKGRGTPTQTFEQSISQVESLGFREGASIIPPNGALPSPNHRTGIDEVSSAHAQKKLVRFNSDEIKGTFLPELGFN
ncbi:MAG: pentapeptide repeat-containing protein [Leptolyngbyaceae cyanobacterium bins.59]|nr:pentapeptide repeat-containing protein [Leptolyngbyaceae cyanobacterium bins.59]